MKEQGLNSVFEILSEPSWILIIFYILLECKSKKIKIAILELKNPYEQIFVGHPLQRMILTIEIEIESLF